MSRWPLRKLAFIPALMIPLIQLPAAQPNSQDTVVEVASGKIDITWPDEPIQLTHSDLDSDWRMTHEIIHLAFPNMADEHRWIEEGISTYVEPVARAQAGQLPPEAVWKEFARDMPQGQPDSGDQGLDNTHTWGRTYWGGALFCLAADVQIREKTSNRKGLRDALRAINSKVNVAEDWE